MKSFPDIEKIRSELRNSELTYRQIANASGLSYSWVAQFAQGHKRNPRLDTLRALLNAIQKDESETDNQEIA